MKKQPPTRPTKTKPTHTKYTVLLRCFWPRTHKNQPESQLRKTPRCFNVLEYHFHRNTSPRLDTHSQCNTKTSTSEPPPPLPTRLHNPIFCRVTPSAWSLSPATVRSSTSASDSTRPPENSRQCHPPSAALTLPSKPRHLDGSCGACRSLRNGWRPRGDRCRSSPARFGIFRFGCGVRGG